jgi:uncharacterized protein
MESLIGLRSDGGSNREGGSCSSNGSRQLAVGKYQRTENRIKNSKHKTHNINVKMKQLFSFFAVITILSGCNSNPGVVKNENDKTAEHVITYDSILAEQLGADTYGMKQYVMAFLKTGPNRDQDSATAAQLQRAHLDNIFRLADEGKLILAGPILDKGEIRGIYVFNVTTIEEAAELTSTDPAIKAGRLVMELHPWYGSAALMQVVEISKRITKEKI